MLLMHWYQMTRGVVYVDYTAECRNKGGEASPIEDYASGCLHLEAGEEKQMASNHVTAYSIILT
jgi:hypothetical protein